MEAFSAVLLLTAMKIAISSNIKNEYTKGIVEKVFEHSSDNVEKWIENYKKSFDLNTSLNIHKIPLDKIDEVRTSINEFLKYVDVLELAKDSGADLDGFKNKLADVYDRMNKEDGKNYEYIGLILSDLAESVHKTIDVQNIEERKFLESCKEDVLKVFNVVNDGFKNTQLSQNELKTIINENFSSLRKDMGVVINENSLLNSYEEYKNRWNKNVFLNNYDILGNMGWKNVKLHEIYKPSSFYQGSNAILNHDISSYVSKRLSAENTHRLLLVLGAPGIGKSSFIVWLLNRTVQDDTLSDYEIAKTLLGKEILVARFSDIDINWKDDVNTIKKYIFSSLLKNNLKNKVLILDGYDEVVTGDKRCQLLNSLNYAVNNDKDADSFNLIITCRENCILEKWNLSCPYITLAPYNSIQMREFSDHYFDVLIEKCSKNMKDKYINKKNRQKQYFKQQTERNDIWGIPLILYMILASEIELEDTSSKTDIYDRLFSIEGGLYDRMFECEGQKQWGKIHSITSQIKYALDLASKKIALWMFVNNSARAEIPEDKFVEICLELKNNDKKLKEMDIEIRQHFDMVKHTEGRMYVQFVHRSIFEYFVAKYIVDLIREDVLNLENDESQRKLLKKIIPFLMNAEISKEIGEHFSYKMLKIYSKEMSLEKQNIFFQKMEDILQDAVFYGFCHFAEFTNKDLKNTLDIELKCFGNYIILLQLLAKNSNKMDYIMYNKIDNKFVQYMKSCAACGLIGFQKYLNNFYFSEIDLRGIDFSYANLRGTRFQTVDLSGANLSNANLFNASFTKVKLNGVNLESAILKGIYIIATDLSGANLSNADCQHASFIESNLERVNLNGSVLDNAIFRQIDLTRSSLVETKMKNSTMVKVNFSYANLERALLTETRFRKSKFYMCRMKNTDLQKINLYYGENMMEYFKKNLLSGATMSINTCDESTRISLSGKGIIWI